MTNVCILPLFVRECKELYVMAKTRFGHSGGQMSYAPYTYEPIIDSD